MVYQAKKKELAFWITNISNRNVTLRDLGLNIKKHSSINLLSKHYYYTIEQIEKSIKEGSIFNKKNIIKIRKIEPEMSKGRVIEISDQPKLSFKNRSAIVIEEVEYEELKLSNEQYANEAADIFEEDNAPIIKR